MNGWIVLLLLYGTCWQIYAPVDRSLTLRILVEFIKSPGGFLTLEQLRSIYSFEDMFHRRLKDMQLYRYIEEDPAGGRYRLTPKGRQAAYWLDFFRRIFNVPFFLQDRPPDS